MKAVAIWLLLACTPAFAQIPAPDMPAPAHPGPSAEPIPSQVPAAPGPSQTPPATQSPQVLTRGLARELSYAEVSGLAAQRNLALASSDLEVPLAEARFRQALAVARPTLSNNFYYAHLDQNLVEQQVSNNRYTLFAAGAPQSTDSLYELGQNQILNRTSLYVPVYTGGRMQSNMHLQMALMEEAKSNQQRARQSLSFDAKRQYLLTALAGENLRLAQQVSRRALENRGFAVSRLHSGVGTKLDVLQADVAVANAQDAVLVSQTSLSKAKSDLAAVVNLPLLSVFALKDGLDKVLEDIPAGDVHQLLELALKQRPELEALGHERKANEERANIARADSLPQLGVSFNYDVLGNPSALGTGPSLMVNLSIPLFDGGVSASKAHEFEARGLQIDRRKSQLVQDIASQVRSAVLTLQEADSRVDLAKAAADTAKETERIASLRYQIGAGTSLDLITAQTSLANANFALADARFRQLLARADLNLAVGR